MKKACVIIACLLAICNFSRGQNVVRYDSLKLISFTSERVPNSKIYFNNIYKFINKKGELLYLNVKLIASFNSIGKNLCILKENEYYTIALQKICSTEVRKCYDLEQDPHIKNSRHPVLFYEQYVVYNDSTDCGLFVLKHRKVHEKHKKHVWVATIVDIDNKIYKIISISPCYSLYDELKKNSEHN